MPLSICVGRVPNGLILDLDLRFEFFGEECLRAGNNDTIACGKARRHKPSPRSWTGHHKLPAFKLRWCDLHIRPCAVASPDHCRLRNHDTRFGSLGRLKMSRERGARAKGDAVVRLISRDGKRQVLKQPDRAADRCQAIWVPV
jgi:hypothetical protein